MKGELFGEAAAKHVSTRNALRGFDVMKGAISKYASRFNSHRMLRRYLSEAYFK
jgi:hypothetical protein